MEHPDMHDSDAHDFALTLDVIADNAPADGNATNALEASLKDNGSWAEGEDVIFTATGRALFTDTGSNLTIITVPPQGVVTVSLTDTAEEVVTVTAAVSSETSVTRQATVTFTESGSGNEGDYILTLQATSGAEPDGEDTNRVTVTLTDKDGNGLKRQIIDLSVSGSARFAGEDTSETVVITDSNGEQSVEIYATTEEEVTVTAVFFDDEGAVLAQATATSGFGQAGSEYILDMTASDGAAPNGQSSNKVTVTLTDKNGKPLGRKIIDLEVSKNALFTDSGENTTSVVTDSEGRKTARITDTVEELVTLTAIYRDDEGNTLAVATAESGFGDAASLYTLTLEAENDAPADGKSENQVTVSLRRKEDDTPVSHVIVDLKATGSAFFQTSGEQTVALVTDKDGLAKAGLSDTVEEVVSLTGMYVYQGGNARGEATSRFGAAHTYSVVVTAEDGAQADGEDRNEVTVTVYDESHAPVPGAELMLSATGHAQFSNGRNELVLATNADGRVMDYITSTTVETVTVTALYTDAGVSGTASSTFINEVYSLDKNISENVPEGSQKFGVIDLNGLINGNTAGSDRECVRNFSVWVTGPMYMGNERNDEFYEYDGPGQNIFGKTQANTFQARLFPAGNGIGRVHVEVLFVDGTSDKFSQRVDVYGEELTFRDDIPADILTKSPATQCKVWVVDESGNSVNKDSISMSITRPAFFCDKDSKNRHQNITVNSNQTFYIDVDTGDRTYATIHLSCSGVEDDTVYVDFHD